MKTEYDQVRYPSSPVRLALPSSMAALAHLRGRPFVPFGRARVLEAGCNTCENILSLAAMAPEAEFVGFDITDSAIEEGQRLAAAAGLTNVRLVAGDILDPHVVEGQFDYVIAHGVYAWVPDAVRDALLALVERVLTPHGLAFISFNVLPGGHLRQGLRTIMLDAMAAVADPAAKVAAANEALAFFAEQWEGRDAAELAMRDEALTNLRRPSGATFHDELAPFYAPVLFGDFVSHVQRRGLDYLWDALPDIGREVHFPSPSGEALRARAGGNPLRIEQLDDFATMRRFREAVIGRPGVAHDAGPLAGRLQDLFFQAQIEPAGEADGKWTFKVGEGDMSTNSAAFAELLREGGAAFPANVPLRGRLSDPRTTRALVELYLTGVARLCAAPFDFARAVGQRPRASGLARAQAARGDIIVATLHHRAAPAPQGDTAFFLSLLDGSRDMAALAAAMAERTGKPASAIAASLRGRLAEFTAMGLMER